MARRIGIPLILDILIVDAADEIRELNNDVRVSRNYRRGGRLINRVVQARILDWLKVRGRPLPAFLPREDIERAAAQRALEVRLTPDSHNDAPGWDAKAIAPLVAYVRGSGADETLGPAVQQLVGRLFVQNYTATHESYEAAKLIDDYLSSRNPLPALWWRVSGKLRRARALLWEMARPDAKTGNSDSKRSEPDGHAIHATTIALHNIVRSLQTMRRLRLDPGVQPRVTSETVVAQCLAAPPRALRRCSENFHSEVAQRMLCEDALIVFDLGRAFARSGDVELAFMGNGWSACPARAFVSALLEAVWRGATR